jgi:hypothetical protein
LIRNQPEYGFLKKAETCVRTLFTVVLLISVLQHNEGALPKKKYGLWPSFVLAQGGPKKKLSRSGELSFGLHGSGTIPILHDAESNFHPQTRLTLHTGRIRRTQSPLI